MLVAFASWFTGLRWFFQLGSIALLVFGLWYAKARYDRYQQDKGAVEMKVDLLTQLGYETLEDAMEAHAAFQAEKDEILADLEQREERLETLESELIETARRQRRSQQAFERRINALGIEVSNIADADLIPAIIGTLARLRQRELAGNPSAGDPAASPAAGGASGPP
jgi:hypothetical protein